MDNTLRGHMTNEVRRLIAEQIPELPVVKTNAPGKNTQLPYVHPRMWNTYSQPEFQSDARGRKFITGSTNWMRCACTIYFKVKKDTRNEGLLQEESNRLLEMVSEAVSDPGKYADYELKRGAEVTTIHVIAEIPETEADGVEQGQASVIFDIYYIEKR